MTPTIQGLVLDLLEWVARKDRTYEETLDAWRTSCPRLTVWEDANEHRFVHVEQGRVRLTEAGFRFLEDSGRCP